MNTWRGNVAEKSTVWRSGRMFCTIIWICGSKPMSNIRSASESGGTAARRHGGASFVSMSCGWLRRKTNEEARPFRTEV